MEIIWDEVTHIQMELNCHIHATNLVFSVFGVGEDHAEKEAKRTRAARELQATTIPWSSLLAKDHKPLEDNGDPKTRIVYGAIKSPNGEMSEHLSEVIEGAIAAQGTSCEAISTEDMLHLGDKVT